MIDLLILQSGVPTSGSEFVDQYGPALISAATTVLLFVLMFALTYYLGKKVLVRATEQSLQSRGLKTGLVSLAVSVVSTLVLVAAIAVSATVAGFGAILTAFATLAGALALGLSFAAQDLISNFVSGVFIIKDEPFKVGDWIEWDGNEGIVKKINLRVTQVETFDNELVTVPNNQLATSVVTNSVANETLRVSCDFGISYDDDITIAREAIIETASSIEGVLADPEPAAPVTELGDSAVVLTGRVWIEPRKHSAAAIEAAFREAVKQRFDAEGIDMPYAHTTLTGGIELETNREASVVSSSTE
ncbi:mechanosensitive ion channel family protein [Natronorubrum daqingense]|uniref:Mechanosensitive ion channel n=1 Tax=Natronorubrum daqingense TaxID=588898 RepID=A0A1N7FKE1_9EURY|nr:mechanosensitive ion channel family protein [Natronorubrum daqingense]APX98351.1 mechanosensitive ion channel protein [Natronorubrum daqingense]SIS00888.1 Mechanosensitive ion channel [Natronorubrum daqingense]